MKGLQGNMMKGPQGPDFLLIHGTADGNYPFVQQKWEIDNPKSVKISDWCCIQSQFAKPIGAFLFFSQQMFISNIQQS